MRKSENKRDVNFFKPQYQRRRPLMDDGTAVYSKKVQDVVRTCLLANLESCGNMPRHFDIIFSSRETKTGAYEGIKSKLAAKAKGYYSYERYSPKIPSLFWAIYLQQSEDLLSEFIEHHKFPEMPSKEANNLLRWSAAFNFRYFKMLSAHFKLTWSEENTGEIFNYALNFGQFDTLDYLSTLIGKPLPLFKDSFLKGDPSFVDALINAAKSTSYQPNVKVKEKLHALIDASGADSGLVVSVAIRIGDLELFTKYTSEKNGATVEHILEAIKEKSEQILKVMLKQKPDLSTGISEIAKQAIQSSSEAIFDLIHEYIKGNYSYRKDIIAVATNWGHNLHAIKRLATDHPDLVNEQLQESNGLTPIMIACSCRDLEMVRHLLKCSAKPSERCWSVVKPRWYADDNNAISPIVQSLLHAGLTISEKWASQVWDAIKDSDDLKLIQKVADELIALKPELKEPISKKLDEIAPVKLASIWESSDLTAEQDLPLPFLFAS